MVFRDRSEAGKKLAERLSEQEIQNPVIVLALPRGGVPVGYEIAKRLNALLDVLVVRKLGAPFQPELGIGAIAPDNVVVVDLETVEELGLSLADVEKIEQKEREELDRRIKEYRSNSSVPDVTGKTVILVDDGLATGVSARAAIKAVLQHNPKKLIVAFPICASDVIAEIRGVVRPGKDDVICLTTPAKLSAVGLWYRDFTQVSDQEVISSLKESQRRSRKGTKQQGIQHAEPEAILHR